MMDEESMKKLFQDICFEGNIAPNPDLYMFFKIVVVSVMRSSEDDSRKAYLEGRRSALSHFLGFIQKHYPKIFNDEFKDKFNQYITQIQLLLETQPNA